LKPGKIIDSLFAFSGAAAINYTSELYISGLAGAFQANYFERNLAKRGMIHSTSGPQLKHFPFFEDGAKILSQIRKFIASFVDSYYHSVSDLEKDYELQAWVEEAWPAQIIDFPTAPITEKQTLIDILTHLAYLVSVLHPTLNTNSLIQTSAVLPFQPWALYQPIPTRKGVSNVTAFLPPLESALGQIAAGSAFSRQQFIGTNRTLTHMFDDDELLAKMNIETRQAATRFKDAMNTISKQISGRHFDQNGLSQGMPFLWKTLDPNVAPFSLAI
jgi:arachidonate 15-lipoxygenase (second type)/8-lipoxygenase (S-type)